MTDDQREPTEFGWYLLHLMAAQQPPLSQADLARLCGVPQSTVSRWIYSAGKPRTDLLATLATALHVDPGELLYRAGHGRPSHVTGLAHPLATELDHMLAPDSPVPPEQRATLEAVIAGVLNPYRQYKQPTKRRRGA